MYTYNDIRSVHLEITSRCNASCPQCPRNINGGRTNPNLPLTELSVSDIQTIFPLDFVRQLRLIYACGNYGDALVARDTLEIFTYFRSAKPDISLKLYTNGSGRDSNWWATLARTISVCTFSIDGLEDTNPIYRRGTVWSRIMMAVEAFVHAGGAAEWEFLVFKHNEHQIDTARALSEHLGFKRFIIKKSARFTRGGRLFLRHPVMNAEGTVEYYIEPPHDSDHRNRTITELDRHISQTSAYTNYLERTPIECKVDKKKSIYVSAEGLVFPCCWTSQLYTASIPPGTGEIWQLIAQLPEGRASLDARKHSIRDIVNGPFFQQLVPAKWKAGPLETRLAVCARTCGLFDGYSAQYQ